MLKGTVSWDFSLQVFFLESSSHKTLKIKLGSFIFFEHSRRYSQVKVDHRYHWHRWCTLSCEYLRDYHWWQNLPPVLLILVANFPPVLLISVVHLDLQISPGIVEKFETALMVCSGTWGKLIHEKKPKVEDLVALSLEVERTECTVPAAWPWRGPPSHTSSHCWSPSRRRWRRPPQSSRRWRWKAGCQTREKKLV